MAVPGATAGVTAGGVPLPNLANPNVAQTFADQAVAGGGSYAGTPGSANTPPLSPQQQDQAAVALQNGQGPSNADLAAGEAYGASLLGGGANPVNPYTQSFQASLANQRQAIDNMLTTSMQQLAGRRNAAAAVVAAIPGQVRGNFQAAEGKAQTVGQAAAAVTKDATGHGAIGGAANNALYQSDYRQNEGAGLAAVPLLNMGVNANYDLGAAGLQKEHLAGIEAIDAQQSAFDAEMAKQTNAEDYQTAANNLAYRRGLAATAASNATAAAQFPQEEVLKGIDPTTGVPYRYESTTGTGQPISGTSGSPTAYQSATLQLREDTAQAKASGVTLGQYQTITNSQPYQQIISEKNPNTAEDILIKQLKAGNKMIANILVANDVMTLAQADAAKKAAGL